MSSIQFFPIRWFEHSSWNSIQVFGRLAPNRSSAQSSVQSTAQSSTNLSNILPTDGRSVYLRIGFRPYFTVRYPANFSSDNINEAHEFLLSETPVDEIIPIDLGNLNDGGGPAFRVHVLTRDNYTNAVAFFESNRLGTILDRDQHVLSKFFAERSLNPGSWQQASNLQTLLFNVTTNNKYTSADLEYFTQKIVSIDLDLPPPQGVLAIFDIEAIPSDDVSFPEADHPPDNIFAISLVVYRPNHLENTVYLLSHHPSNISSDYQTSADRTEQVYSVTVVPVSSERELLEKFFEGLQANQPDRLVSMNGRRFDLNYIGARARALGVKIPHFTKILTYQPYFDQMTLVQVQPFPLSEQVWAIDTPGISQIDILDFYRRLYPQLGSHRLEILSQLILGRGKTGLSIPEMFARYRRGDREDYEIIIDYSITDSIRVAELWTQTDISRELANMANLWKNDAEYVITTPREELFEDLLRYITPIPPPKQYQPGKPPLAERTPGIHRNVYLYSLSEVYLTFLEQLLDPLTQHIVEYFRETNDGIIPFKSGYFPTQFSLVDDFLQRQGHPENWVWVEDNSLAIRGEPFSSVQPLPESARGFSLGEMIKGQASIEEAMSDQPRTEGSNRGPLPIFQLIDTIPLIVVVNKSWILINSAGLLFKKGLSAVVRPPFQLLQRYVDYLIQHLIDHPDEQITFPEMPTEVEDFVLEMKINAEDFSTLPSSKVALINQLQEIGSLITTSWRKVRYIRTKKGPIIEEIYSADPDRYIPQIDTKWYNETVNRAITSITSG